MECNAKLKKMFLKTLPIWTEATDFRIKLDQLSHDLDVLLNALKNNERELESIPKINTTGKMIVQPVKSDRDKDIIKLYKSDGDGTCSLIDDEVSFEGVRLYKNSSMDDSLSILSQKLHTNEPVFAMLKKDKPWMRCQIRSVVHMSVDNRPSTVIKLNLKTDNGIKVYKVKKYALARAQKHGDKLRVGKRVIAGPTEENMRPGIIAQEPAGYNKNRYMIFLDDGNAKYFEPEKVYPVCYQSRIPWFDYKFLEDRHKKALDEDYTYYFKTFPRRHLLEARIGMCIDICRNGHFDSARIVAIDADTLKLVYKDDIEEWVYAGTARILKRLQKISHLISRSISIDELHYKLVHYMKYYNQAGVRAIDEDFLNFFENFTQPVAVCGMTARKSTGSKSSPPRTRVTLNNQRVDDDSETCPQLTNLIESSERHHQQCSPDCLDIPDKRTEAQIDNFEEEFRNISDIKVPLLIGWRRILVSGLSKAGRNKKFYVYEAPCGRILKSETIKSYFRQTRNSQLDHDFFTFDRDVILNTPESSIEAIVYEPNVARSRQGKPLERKYISLINLHNEERLPADFEYRNETFPHPMLRAKGFSFNREFKSGCDCDGDCSQRAACACHKLNEEAAGSKAFGRGEVSNMCQYKSKRLIEQVSTGIFECNEFCKCSSKCPNRVVQNGIRTRLQLRKTVAKGWGVFALDFIPKGSFICTYSAELLDDADQYGADDMYFADLDYISVVEEGKFMLEDEQSDEGVESDSSSDDSANAKQSKKKAKNNRDADENVSDLDELVRKYSPQNSNNETRYPKRNQQTQPEQPKKPSNRPRFRPIFEILEESHDTYTLDARMQGNIGRFFNHSCDPNAFVQNVFIDTHDLRFPVVAFFAKSTIKADDEITWNYNYKINSIAGRCIVCNCNASNCKGRIL